MFRETKGGTGQPTEVGLIKAGTIPGVQLHTLLPFYGPVAQLVRAISDLECVTST